MDNPIESFKKARKKLTIYLPATPNQISGLSVITSIGIIYNPIASILVTTFLDMLDGAVARAKKLETKEENSWTGPQTA